MSNRKDIDKSEEKANITAETVSPAVIRRLPRYFRYLRELIRMGKTRVSSAELSQMMNVTASQIRQDLNCFGGFGQQGYGYNVNYLYTKICEILGVGEGYRAAVIGAGNLGTALVRSPMFENRGVDVVAMFDVSEELVGKTVAQAQIYHTDELVYIFEDYDIDIAILTCPKDNAYEIAQVLKTTSVKGIWNFTGKDLELQSSHIAVEDVHIGDSLMTLCYDMLNKEKEKYGSDK